MDNHQLYLKKAIDLSLEHSRKGDNGPFGAVVVLNGEIAGLGWNRVVRLNDPTAHAEITAIRNACSNLKTHDLSRAVLYSSCEPCPMCLSAIFWARIKQVFYACTRYDAAAVGFDDKDLYEQFTGSTSFEKIQLTQMLHKQGLQAFENWKNNPDRIMY
jgi:tRNA(Arg) A34 adenosine deaminase TadA